MRMVRHRLGGMGLQIVATLAFLFFPVTGWTYEFAQRSVSNSGQFIVYCPDVGLRLAVTSYAETAKEEVLKALGQGDHWKFPIVIDLRRPASTDTNIPLRQVRMVLTDGGWRVEAIVLLRQDELKQVRFPQLLMRAILLELAYRDHPPEVGKPCTDPPSWLVESLADAMQAQTTGAKPNAALFQQMIATGELPKIRDFLTSNVDAMDAASLAVHDSCASSLLAMLTGTPEGKASLSRMVKGMGNSDGDPVALLLKYFPVLGDSETNLEKWWTLGLARYSLMDASNAMTVAETDARLTPLLTLTVVTDEKTKDKKEFAFSDFKTFLKLPGAKLALLEQSKGLVELMARAHPLLRPVIQQYLNISNDLATGKKRGIEKSLSEVAGYRELIVARMDKIDDYLNWFEATQMPERSRAFDDFLQSAKAEEKWTPPKRNDAISKYIDQLQREFE